MVEEIYRYWSEALNYACGDRLHNLVVKEIAACRIVHVGSIETVPVPNKRRLQISEVYKSETSTNQQGSYATVAFEQNGVRAGDGA